MRSTGRIVPIALGVFLVSSVGVAGATAGRIRAGARTAAAAETPPGYKVVTAGFTAPTGLQTAASVPCPAKTVVLGGGALIASNSVLANINSSIPHGNRTWTVKVNNASGADTSATVYAICAHKPTGYQQVTAPVIDNPGDTRTDEGALCPSGKKVFGGGAFSTSTSVGIAQSNSLPGKTTAPTTYAWAVTMDNLTKSDNTFSAVAICGKITGYKFVTGTSQLVPVGAQVEATATCPGTTVPLGGGVHAKTLDLGTSINTSAPVSNQWAAFVGNNTSSAVTITATVTCAP